METAIKLKRSTVYLEPELHRALKIQAAETESNVSELINNAIKEALLEDRDDLAAFKDRAQDELVTFEEVLNDLKLDETV